MRKIFLTILLFCICSTAHAATTWYLCSGGGNWNGASVWTSIQVDQVGCTASTGNPVAGDTAILNSTSGQVTLSANAAAATVNMTGYASTLTLGSFQLTITAGLTAQGDIEGTGTSGIILVQGGGVTLAATPTTSSLPILKMATIGQTMTSGGFTWPGSLQWDFVGTFTLLGNWVTSGLTTYTLASVVNHTTTESYTGNGGLTLPGSSGIGNATLIFNGGTLAFGTSNLHGSGLIEVGGAMTSTSGGIFPTGGITLLNTPTGTFPSISCASTQTLTSGGFTWPGALILNNATQTDTLVGNWINTGLLTIASAVTLNLTTSETFTANGGITLTAGSLGGSANILFNNGTWTGAFNITNNLIIGGNITVSGSVDYGAGTLTYSSGTVIWGTSIINIISSCTLNLSGTVPNEILNGTAATTLTLTSALTTNNLYLEGNNVTFAGSFNITAANLVIATLGAGKTFIFVSGTTVAVTTSMNITTSYLAASVIQSSTGSSSFNLNYTGTSQKCIVSNFSFTDTNASASSQPIYNYGAGTSEGVLTRTTNIIPATQINLFHGQGFAY